jgi:hypothetical protein
MEKSPATGDFFFYASGGPGFRSLAAARNPFGRLEAKPLASRYVLTQPLHHEKTARNGRFFLSCGWSRDGVRYGRSFEHLKGRADA